MRQLHALALVLLAASVTLLVRPPVAWAHALLVRSDPPANARLLTPPARVSTWFSEPVQPGVSALRVLDGSGRQVSGEPVTFDPAEPTRMSVALAGELPPGFYLVVWETLSRVDGHFRLGSFEFIVLNPDGSLPLGPRLAATPLRGRAPMGVLPAALVKFAALVGTAVVVGGAVFTLAVMRPAIRGLSSIGTAGTGGLPVRRALTGHLRRLTLPGLALLALTGAAELLLQARPLGGVTALGVVLRTTWGERWLWRQAALALLAATLAVWWRFDVRRSPMGLTPWLALLGGAAYLVLTAATSHAAALPTGSAWATLFDVLHLGATAVWVGGLLCLTDLLLWSGRAVPEPERAVVQATAVRCFSPLAATSVVLLLATGLLNALVHVASWSALGQTAYGRALTVKLLLTVPLLAVAGTNAFLLRPRFVRAALQGEATGALRRRLTRLVAMEAALALAVLLVVGVLVQEPPARLTVEGNRGPFAYPLVVGTWALPGGVLLLVGGLLLWLWSSAQRGRTAASAAPLRALRFALLLAGLALALTGVATPTSPEAPAVAPPSPAAGAPASSGVQAGAAGLALRYQAPDGRFVLLEVTPWAIGVNRFRVTVLDVAGHPLAVQGVTLRLSRLEQEEAPREVPAVAPPGERALQAEAVLPTTGWWAIEVRVSGSENEAVSFYLRLDEPSGAPLHVAPPDYPSDPAAERLFRRSVAQFEGLKGLRWREELTSGLLAPTGIGAWVLTTGEAAAPDRLRLHVLSPGFSDYELVRVGDVSCTRLRGQRCRCERLGAENPFDLDFQAPATAFRLGRRERVDGEMTRVLLFYNPAQPAWYAWWIGEGSGQLRRQAMVAPGHVMLTRFFDHDAPVAVALPPEARCG